MFISQLVTALIISTSQNIYFEEVHKNLTFDEPVQALFDGVDGNQLYIVEKQGVVRSVTLEKTETNKPIFLNIKDRVDVGHSEEGLLSIAFHPEYKTTPKIFVWYTAHSPRRCVLSSFVTNDNGTADPDTEEKILEVLQPWGNHNGGTVIFGPDGYLYLGVGDGGGSNDTKNNGQNKNTLLGTILRIDIDSNEGDSAYSIPKDNPFVGESGSRGEIWAYGMRNPWRMSFDKSTGKLWAADVGQNKWEEIDIIEKGKNYGWNIREGKHSFGQPQSKEGTTNPIFEYGRKQGGSITGGYVYRGKKIPKIHGQYIFSDYLSGRVWRLVESPKEDAKYKSIKILTRPPISISSFGETPSGEILACGFASPYSTKGKIYLLVPAGSADSSPNTDKTR